MKVFLGSEAERFADDIITPFRNSVNEKIQTILTENAGTGYGSDVELLCIITTCVSDEFLQNSGWKERVRYSKKDKTTDLRLRIDYDKLLTSSKKEQYYLYLNNIIESIERLKAKYPKLDFDAPKLVDDIKKICVI